MRPFKDAPEFIERDNRQFRTFAPISEELMHNKHEALLPPELVAGRTVLDLGCCLGTTGQWVLAHGAAHYTGVEAQETYASAAQELLGQYHPGKFSIHHTSIEEWFRANTDTYDIVCLLGVLYVFTDYYSVLKQSAACARQLIALDSIYHNRAALGEDFCGAEFTSKQIINLSDEHASLAGRGSRVSPKGLQFLMQEFGFVSEGVLLPKPITNGQPDMFHMPIDSEIVSRFLMRFTRAGEETPSLSQNLVQGKKGLHVGWDY